MAFRTNIKLRDDRFRFLYNRRERSLLLQQLADDCNLILQEPSEFMTNDLVESGVLESLVCLILLGLFGPFLI